MKMIHGFFIIDKKSGIALISKLYTEIGVNPEILPSFVSALWLFSEKELTKKGKINEEKLAGYKWVYSAEGDLIFLLITDLSDRSSWLRFKLEHLKEEFFKMFPNAKENQREYLDKYVVVQKTWQPFGKVVDEALSDWGIAEKNIEMAKILDILDVYQKIITPLYMHLTDEGKQKVQELYRTLKDELKLDLADEFNIEMHDQKIMEAPYKKVKELFNMLLPEIINILIKDSSIEYARWLLRISVFPIIRSEMSRITIYRLTENIMYSILI